jgi:hypothetical protein
MLHVPPAARAGLALAVALAAGVRVESRRT